MARNLESTQQMMTNFAGTPLYLPPEIINGQPYSFKADIWSLGVVLFEIANLCVPFLDLNFPSLLLKICSAKTPDLPSHFSPELRGFISDLLEKEQEQRMDINGIFQSAFMIENMKVYEYEYKHLCTLKKLSNFKIDSFKLNEEFTNLRTNRFTIYAADTRKILEEANNSAKPSRFRFGPNSVFASNMSGLQNNEKNFEPQNNFEEEEDFPLKESVLVLDSNVKQMIDQESFSNCVTEFNDPLMNSSYEIYLEKINSEKVRNDFADLGMTHHSQEGYLKNTLLNETEYDLNYTRTVLREPNHIINPQAKDKQSINHPYINPAFYNSYLKNNVFQPTVLNPKNNDQQNANFKYQINETNQLMDSEIRKKQLNDAFLDRMCAQQHSDLVYESIHPEKLKPTTNQLMDSEINLKSPIVNKSVRVNKSSNKTGRAKNLSRKKISANNFQSQRPTFLIFSKHERWEKFELSSSFFAADSSRNIGHSTRLIKLNQTNLNSPSNYLHTSSSTPHKENEVPLSLIGLDKLLSMKQFRKKNCPTIVNDHSVLLLKSKMNDIANRKNILDNFYGNKFALVYSFAKRFVQFFGICKIEKNICNLQKIMEMANGLDAKIFGFVKSSQRLVELVELNIAEMKTECT